MRNTLFLWLGGFLSILASPKSFSFPYPALNIPLRSDEVVLDLHAMEDVDSMMTNHQLHRGLFRYSAEGVFTPDLAEIWRFSDDGKSLKVKLRKATFSDGQAITPEHVVNTFARLFAKEAAIGADLSALRCIAAFKKSRHVGDLGVRAELPNTVVFEFERKHALSLKLLAAVDCRILALKKFDEPYAVSVRSPVSGPYLVSKLDKNTIELEKWRADDLDSARPAGLIRLHLDVKDPVALAKEDALDTLDRYVLTPPEVELLVKKGWSRAITELATERMLILNPKRLPAATRRRIARAIDSKWIAQKMGKDFFKPAYGVIPTGVLGALVAPRARVGSVAPLTAPEKRIVTVLMEDSPFNQKLFPFVQKQLSQKEVNSIAEWVSKKEWMQRLFKGEFEVTLGQKGLDYFDGYSVLSYFRSGYDANVFFVHDASIDLDLDEVVSIEDEGVRAKKYGEIQEKILNHETVVPLMFGSNASGLWSRRLKSVPSHPGGIQNLPFQSLEIVEDMNQIKNKSK